MRVEYGDDGQAAIAQYMKWATLSKLLSFSTVPLVYGRFDGDDGDDETIVSSERIDDHDESEDGD